MCGRHSSHHQSTNDNKTKAIQYYKMHCGLQKRACICLAHNGPTPLGSVRVARHIVPRIIARWLNFQRRGDTQKAHQRWRNRGIWMCGSWNVHSCFLLWFFALFFFYLCSFRVCICGSSSLFNKFKSIKRNCTFFPERRRQLQQPRAIDVHRPRVHCRH